LSEGIVKVYFFLHVLSGSLAVLFKKKQFDDCASVCLEAKHVSTARLCACRVTSTSAPSTVQTVASGATDTSEDLCKKGVANTPWAGPRGLVFDVSYLLGHGVIVNLSLF